MAPVPFSLNQIFPLSESPIPRSRVRVSVFGFSYFVSAKNSNFPDLLNVPMSNPPKTAPDEEDTVQIREVWDSNLETEFLLILDIVDAYPFVAMDTEFPGIVCRPMGTFKFSSESNYATLKANVDMLNLIQLGLTFYNTDGSLPVCADTGRRCVWQFNFREFDVQKDMFATDSIELLKHSGIDFKRNSDEGVDVKHFAELLMSSGIVLNDCVHWVTFHSGYDFGYLLKLLTCQNLPDTQAVFFTLIKVYFPNLYDIKHLMKFCNSLHGGLNKLAELLEVERVGVCHQAGSDSLLTADTFRKLQESFFNGNTEKHAVLFSDDGFVGGNVVRCYDCLLFTLSIFDFFVGQGKVVSLVNGVTVTH